MLNFVKNIIRKRFKRLYLFLTAAKKSLQGQPVSVVFGTDRGTPIDRVYIDDFLSNHAESITGDVLEIAENTYTLKFSRNLKQSHVLCVTADCPAATIIGNLETGENIPENKFDCMIITQTFAFIYDVRSVVKNCHKALKPGGILLLTNPALSPVSTYDMERWGDFWRFTPLSMKRLLEECFPKDQIEIKSYGNYYTVQAFMAGKAAEELNKSKMYPSAEIYPIVIAASARK